MSSAARTVRRLDDCLVSRRVGRLKGRDEWQLSAAAVTGLQNLTDRSQPEAGIAATTLSVGNWPIAGLRK